MSQQGPDASPVRFLRAFEAPGYRWLWLNLLFTQVVWTVDLLSQGWLVLQLTNSAFWVGLAAGVRGTSQAVFSLPGGSLADRFDRRKILLVVQPVGALGAAAIALLTITRTVRPWHILIYLAAVGLVNAVSRPATGGLVYDMVGAGRLLNASAFQFMAASFVRIVGAIAGGIIIDRLGVGANYLLIALASLAGTGVLLPLRSSGAPGKIQPLMQAVRSGLGYAIRTPPVRHLLLLSLIIEAFGFSYSSMLPVMARDVLHVGGSGLGDLAAMGGVGQLAATLLVASRGEVRRRGTLMVAAAVGFGLFVGMFGLSPWFVVSLFLIVIVGALGSTYDTTMATALQTATSDAMRGRVLGLYSSTIGLNALGGLGVGILATALGAPSAVAISGSLVVVTALGLLPGRHMFDLPHDGAPVPAGDD